ncbi:MAG: nucleotidyltransferase family protein [Thioalkalispiraceae bacterium]|jgi:molybdenum cofactor cytidylyltransferase
MSKLPVGILLAAGQSARFGSNKLLHPINNDTPMLLVTAEKLASVLPDSIAVIHHDLLPHTRSLVQLGLKVVVNEQAQQGMGSSIACGVRTTQDATGWLITLADMPYIKIETIKKIANRLKDGADLVAPFFEQQRGHPVGFSQRYKTELLALNDDVGARNILEKHRHQLELIQTHDTGIVKDIDYTRDIDLADL